MTRLIRLYRTTEGLVLTLAVYCAVAYGTSLLLTAAEAVAAPLALLVGAVGFYLWAETVHRVLEAVDSALSGFFIEVMGA